MKALVLALVLTLVAMPGVAVAQSCRRAAIVTLPGTTWADVIEFEVSPLLDAVRAGAAGSVSVRTNTSRTTVGSGFATIGAGSRVDVDGAAGAATQGRPLSGPPDSGLLSEAVEVAGREEIRRRLDEADYRTVMPGALGSVVDMIAIGNGDVGIAPPSPGGAGRWPLLAAMDEDGVVGVSATSSELLRSDESASFGIATDNSRLRTALVEATERFPCASLIVDHGDLVRVDAAESLIGSRDPERRGHALVSAAFVVEAVREVLDPDDLLIVVSPSSPVISDDVHLGVAIVVGPGFEPGSSLESPSTRRPGLVTLTDIAPTILAHVGAERPASMQGRPMFSVDRVAEDRVRAAIDLDAETVFIDDMVAPIATGFVLVQLAAYAVTIGLLRRQDRSASLPGPGLSRGLSWTALALAAFPIATYLAGLFQAAPLGVGGYLTIVIGLDIALVLGSRGVGPAPLDRLLAVATLTVLVFAVDLVAGAHLQINTLFGYSPVVAGRFSGLGNSAFGVFAAATVLTGALAVHRFGRSRELLAAVGVLFAAVVVLDGGPNLGADVGGALALVPGLALTWWLLAGHRITLGRVVVAVIGAAVVVGALLAFDLSRPPDSQTHLARFYESVRADGAEVFWDTVSRKVGTNLRVARSTVWALLVPPALGAIAWLLLRPKGRWRRLSETWPALRAALIGGLVLAILGDLVNDSGIVVPAVMFAYLVPVALLAHLSTEPARRARAGR